MSSDTSRKQLDAEREESRKAFEAQEDKTVPHVSSSVIQGTAESTLDSVFDEVRRMQKAGKAAIVVVAAVSAPSGDPDGDVADGYLELISEQLSPRDLLLFTNGDMPARFADHFYAVIKRCLETQILNLAAESAKTPEEGN